jgi:adenylate cyclase
VAEDAQATEKLTWFQRGALRRLRRKAGRKKGEPLEPGDWMAVWAFDHDRPNRIFNRFMRALPASPRCGACGAPFAGVGSVVARPLGFRPSRKNPNLCATCVELSPPGGAKMTAGIMFADLRGFTAASEGADPADVSATLRRFYGHAEQVLFPEALIDKLIGDEVMALNLPLRGDVPDEDELPALMVRHALELLAAVGYGTPEGPFVELGVGLDLGEAFVGNIGDRAVYDFTAVGDVVNTASRLQGCAAGGEVFVSERVAAGISDLDATEVEVELKGKAVPQRAYRLQAAG